MNFLQQINEDLQYRDLATVLENITEIGFDVHDDDILDCVLTFIPESAWSDEDAKEFRKMRSSRNQARELAIGAGIDPDELAQRAYRSQGEPPENNPRLGLDLYQPDEGQYVLLSGGQGIGKIVAVDKQNNKVNAIIVKDNNGNERVIRRKYLVGPKKTKKGLAWMERS